MTVSRRFPAAALAFGAVPPEDSPPPSSPLRQSEQLPPPRGSYHPYPMPDEVRDTDLFRQTRTSADAKSTGCVACHQNTCDPHEKATVHLGCSDCHGGDPTTKHKDRAHVQPHFHDAWRSSANPVRSYTLLNHEKPEFIRFVNPGDLRIAHITCGQCHPNEVLQNRMSMMTHGCMLWGAALYNNGAVPAQAATLRRKLQHAWHAAADANLAAADRG